MKLTDLSIIFVALFICLVLPLEIRIKDDREKYYSKIQDNLIIDRIAEDVMTDVVITESEKGRAIIDEKAVADKFEKLIKLAYDVDDDVSLSKVYDAFLLRGFSDYDVHLSYDESEEIRRLMENDIDRALYAKRSENYRRDAMFYTMTFPYSQKESRYQNVFGPTYFAVFDPDDGNMPWKGYDRVVVSGSRIQKNTSYYVVD